VSTHIEQAMTLAQSGGDLSKIAGLLVGSGKFDVENANRTAEFLVNQYGQPGVVEAPATIESAPAVGVDTEPEYTDEDLVLISANRLDEGLSVEQAAQRLVDSYEGTTIAEATELVNEAREKFFPSAPEVIAAPTSKFREIARAALARGEKRVVPIAVGGKNPCIRWAASEANIAAGVDTRIDAFSTEEWAEVADAWVEELAQKFPDANAAVIAKPNEFLFIDEDSSKEFRDAYEQWSGEKFPNTYATSARENRLQSHWIQTDATRKMGNVVQGATFGGMISVRQRNEYVLSEGSQHKNGVDYYRSVGGAEILPMPEKLVQFIQSLRIDRNKDTNDFTKKPEGWLDEPFVHGNINNQVASFIGHYISAKNMNDAEELYTLIEKRIEKNGCFYEDGVTPFPWNREEVREMCREKVRVWKTGEEKRGQALVFNQKPTPAEWGEPVVMNDSLSPVPPFDTRWLPESIRAWVVDVAERMSVPVDFTAVCALSALAGATGRRVFVYPLKNDKEWKEAICLPGAVVAASGKKKTPTWKPFMNPLEAVEAEWREEYKKAFSEYKVALKEWKAMRKQAEKQDVLFTTPEPREPSPPKRLLINDATYEVIQDILTTNSQGILYFRDELSGWVSELDREGREGQRQFFLSLMNGNDHMSVDRITRDGGSAVLCGTVFGSFQPELLRQFLFESKSVADGTVPRFHLLVWPDETESRAKTDRQANTLAKDAYRTIVETLAPLKEESMFFHFDGEAQELFYRFRDRLDSMVSKESNPGKQSHLLKYEGALPKLAGLFQLLDLVTFANPVPAPALSLSSADAANPVKTVMVPPTLSGDHTIDAKHYQMAEDFLLEYLVPHMHRVYDSKRNDIQQATYLLADKIRRGELRDGTSVRDIQRKRWVEMAHVAEFALENLAEMNWVRPMPKPAGPGQHAVRYEVNPKAVVL
jgi:hypothetical protein